jgi:hypothetical protein
MSISVLKHNKAVNHKFWWRRYFWSKHEYYAKHAVHRAAQRAKVARMDGYGQYFFWSNVSLRAAVYCERTYGPVPELLVQRPIRRNNWTLSSPEVSKWLQVTSPFLSQKGM